MSIINDYTFGVSNPTIDEFIQKPYPALTLNDTSPGGLYDQVIEIGGNIWLVTNAAWSPTLLGFVQQNVAKPSSALVFMNAGTVFSYTAPAAAPLPIVWTGQQLSQQGLGFVSLAWYGGAGDANTDNLPAFISAFTALRNAGGGTLVIPSGIWLVSGPTGQMASNMKMIGMGIDATTIRVKPGSGANFAPGGNSTYFFSAAIGPSTNVYIGDLTIDGNILNAVYPIIGSTNTIAGRMVLCGDNWTCERVRLTGKGDFGFSLGTGTHNVKCLYCRSEGNVQVNYGGTLYGGNDHFGGGGMPSGIGENEFLVLGCYYGPNQKGNFADWVNTINGVIAYCVIDQGLDTGSGNIIMEGCSDITIFGNTTAQNITINSDGTYPSHTSCTFPRNNKVIANVLDLTVQSTGPVGIWVKYVNNAGAATRTYGGGNIVAQNTIRNTPLLGILYQGDPVFCIAEDKILDNVVINTNVTLQGSYNTGVGTYVCAGIGVGNTSEAGLLIRGNSVEDNRAQAFVPLAATTPYGFYFTGGGAQTMTAVRFLDNTVRNATTVGTNNGVWGTGGGTITRCEFKRNRNSNVAAQGAGGTGGLMLPWPNPATAVTSQLVTASPMTFPANAQSSPIAFDLFLPFGAGAMSVTVTQGGVAYPTVTNPAGATTTIAAGSYLLDSNEQVTIAWTGATAPTIVFKFLSGG